MHKKLVASVSALMFLAVTAWADDPSPRYAAEIAKWRRERDADIRHNWLTLVGLFWLKPGENSFGSDPKNPVALPKGKAPEQAGVFELDANRTIVRVAPAARITNGGHRAHTLEMKPDTSGRPTILQLGSLRMHVIQRGERLGVRVKDLHSPALARFQGLHYFALNPAYILSARFVAFEKPQQLSVPTVLGRDAKMESPGLVEFELQGKKLRLQPVIEDKKLFFIFRDLTSGKQTYPPGRFLYADWPKDGKVILDFNKAQNPPCAFTPYATCPLPPKQNYLDVAIEAGEVFQGH